MLIKLKAGIQNRFPRLPSLLAEAVGEAGHIFEIDHARTLQRRRSAGKHEILVTFDIHLQEGDFTGRRDVIETKEGDLDCIRPVVRRDRVLVIVPVIVDIDRRSRRPQGAVPSFKLGKTVVRGVCFQIRENARMRFDGEDLSAGTDGCGECESDIADVRSDIDRRFSGVEIAAQKVLFARALARIDPEGGRQRAWKELHAIISSENGEKLRAPRRHEDAGHDKAKRGRVLPQNVQPFKEPVHGRVI